MMQLNCLPLRNISVANRVLNQHILHSASGCRLAFFLSVHSFFPGANEQPVENIEKNCYNNKTQGCHSETSSSVMAHEVL